MHQSKVSNFNNIFSKIGFNDPISSQGATFKLTFYGHMDEEVTPQTFLTEGNDNTFTLSNSLFDITVTFDVTSGGITVTNVSKSEGPSWSDSQEVINQTLFSSDTASFVDVEGLGKIELSYTNSEGVTKIASVEVQQGSWNDGTGSVLAETENFLPYSDRYTTVEVEDVVARVHKNTGKFEGIKGIETGPEDQFDTLLSPLSLSDDGTTLTVGTFTTCWVGFETKVEWDTAFPGVSDLYFSNVDYIDSIEDNYMFKISHSGSNFTISPGPLWYDPSVESFNLIHASSQTAVGSNSVWFWSEQYIDNSDGTNQNYINEATPVPIYYSQRFNLVNHSSVSRQGECTFSEIVETGGSTSVSINKNTGVLTCSEFIEGNYNTTIKYLDGFSGSVSGNKITCNNGYTFELFSDSESSVPVSFSDLFSSSLVSFVGLTDPSDSSGYSITGGLNSSSNFIFFDTTYNSSTGTRNWSDSMKLYVDSIGFSNINLSVYYIKITDPEGTSKLYMNSSDSTPYFHPISDSNQLWIPSRYRYQNYLI